MREKILAIDKELTGPDGAAALARYDNMLVGLQSRIEEQMNYGLPPSEYDNCNMLNEAATLARKILRLTVRCGGMTETNNNN